MTVPVASTLERPSLSKAEFTAGFHAIGEERYHHKHPFHLLMHDDKLTRGQLQAWALNRYFYQNRIPVKDAAILARREDPAFRLAWRKRIPDHDGDGTKPGGIERWLKVVEATGLSRDLALRGDGILPATRFAVQAYVDFVSTRWHREEQDKAHAAVRAKCDILRAQLDALYFAYVNPGWPPPGALQPAKENA
ncbi:MAG: pyrroloquinoline quinone biosynthesis protein PqqC [Acidobacteria bacterium]|nr:MAG: pyrroloquinoline quinone biosynthesis protein PqqC [Acidobacteriota bacterium]